jgi:hypothetical protein
MVRRFASVVVLGLLCFGTGCATLRGDTQKMRIESEPSGAQLTVDGKNYTTPADVALKRKEAHRITVTKEGYRPITFNLESTWDGASMTDLALPGGSALLGLSVVSGSDRQFNQLGKIRLEKTSEANPKPLEMFQFRGKLLTKAEYDKAVADELKDTSRFMGPANN